MFVVAPSKRENEFRKILEQPTFKPIEKQVHFWNYEKVEKLFNAEKDTHELSKQRAPSFTTGEPLKTTSPVQRAFP